MRVAALYDIHANLPALEAVLADLSAERVDAVVVGGDTVPGPEPIETLAALSRLELETYFIAGNGERECVELYDQGRTDPRRERGPADITAAFTAARLTPEHRDELAALPLTVTLDVDGLGPTMFCHGSPRSDVELITTATPDERLGRLLSGLPVGVAVGGHTHRQFDRRVGPHRFVNAGSVGLPYEGRAGAYWALLGPEVELRRSVYDVTAALERMRRSGYPDLEESLRESLLEPADPDEVAALFERAAD